jgi:hypothetical protein
MLFDVGEAWASYGLKMAELALNASARTLIGVSKVLGNLAEELNREGDHEKTVIETQGS